MKSKRYVDMHLHTTFSDGSSLPEQVVKDAALLGLQVVAITDHDNTLGYMEGKRTAEEWNIELISGVEITQSKYHILAYGFDVENERLQELMSLSKERQEKVMEARIKKLQKAGIPITADLVKRLFSHPRIGSYNTIMAMMTDPVCRPYIGSLSAREINECFFGPNGIAPKVEKEYLPLAYVIETIHNARGKAIIAHPFKQERDAKHLDKLVEAGIDGLEIQPNYGDKNNIFKEYALEKGLIITYGSDYHGAISSSRPMLIKGENRVLPFWQ